jgi:fructose/tagatose bisphosphate aldolase
VKSSIRPRHRRFRRSRTRRARLAGNHEGRQGRRPRRRRPHDPRTTADRPDQAADFVKQTNCDALAIAIGTSHGAYKFTKKPTGDILAIDRIKEIHARIPNTHLVMHGSSSVPQELLAEIREFGGDMKETYGVPVEEIVKGIKHGVRKVNIDTDIRLAMTGAIRRYMTENPGKFDPRDYLKPAREAAKKICLARFEAFGCAGQRQQDQGHSAGQDGRALHQGRVEPDRQIS